MTTAPSRRSLVFRRGPWDGRQRSARDSIGYRITSADLHNCPGGGRARGNAAVSIAPHSRSPPPAGLGLRAGGRCASAVTSLPGRAAGATALLHPMDGFIHSTQASHQIRRCGGSINCQIRGLAWPGLAHARDHANRGLCWARYCNVVKVCPGLSRCVELCQGVPSSLAGCAEGKTRLLRPIREASTIRENMSMSFGIL